MDANNASKSPMSPAATVTSNADLRSRRGSSNSISTVSQVDKEQMAQALDKIHTTASQSDALTTFNDFAAPPPISGPLVESKGTTGDLVQQGLSGLYSRIKEAVGVGKVSAQEVEELERQDASSRKSKTSGSSITRVDSAATGSAFNVSQTSDALNAATLSSTTAAADLALQMPQSSKASSVTTVSTARSGQTLPKMAKTAAPSAVDPTVAPVTVSAFKDKESMRGLTTRTAEDNSRRSLNQQPEAQKLSNHSRSSTGFDAAEARYPSNSDRIITPRTSRREDAMSHDGSSDTAMSPKGTPSSASTLQVPGSHPSKDGMRKPAVIDRISRSRNSGEMGHSRSSSMEPGAAEPSPVSMSAHGSVYHESFSHNERPQQLQSGGMRIPGTTANEGAPGMANAKLELMRKQVLSKEFWMADETTKECFACGSVFSAFRRKHHCRTCGCIFDSKCTSIISGQKFGVPGSLRVCKTCLDIINRRYEDGSDDSADDSYLPAIFRSNPQSKLIQSTKSKMDDEVSISERMEDYDDNRMATAPMMAIPATRRLGESNRHSAVLEIDAPQLSRPSSSRSLKSLAGGRPQSSGHRRHHSKHNFLGRFKGSPVQESAVPFRKPANEESQRKSKLPAFHDDNIIDPELAPYMSEESSGDEQMSMFATLNSSDIKPSSLDPDKSGFGPFLTAGRRHRRQGEKSISGLSFTSRGPDDGGPSTGAINHGRTSRRRNMSTTSNTAGYLRSPRPRSGLFGGRGPGASTDSLAIYDVSTPIEPTELTRSTALRENFSQGDKLSVPSLQHVKKLFGQLLEDEKVPNAAAWEKALIPILVRCSNDVDPDTREGDLMDVRHYVKFKKIPGGKPGDTSYVSGVIFTKNLALKSMPRRILNPRIVIVSFPIEYQRHSQHQQFMSLQPVIEQEKEYLRMVVNRIANLRPHILLAEKSVSGVALQLLNEAGIAVAYNVKQAVIEAVSRCAKADIISSLDMLALPTQVGQAGGFEVKTFVNNDFVSRKKTYIFISGCKKSLGCTIALRGANTTMLHKIKKVTEFMIYVVYNLKLEASLLRDHFVYMGTESDIAATITPSRDGLDPSQNSLPSVESQGKQYAASVADDKPSESEMGSQSHADSVSNQGESQTSADVLAMPPPEVPRKLLSLHHSHSHTSHDSHVPEDVPAPTFYSDMVSKYETKILSASPFVRFTQPYLLMQARQQESRLVYLKRLRDQDIIEEHADAEKVKPQKFQLIKPEMVHEIGQKAPRQIMEILHAVHDAEYDKALYNYQVQTRQWENYIAGSLDLFDPYAHQNIVVLYSVICTETKIPCSEPGLIGFGFYHDDPTDNLDPDCTLGQYIEDLCGSSESICHANGCDRQMAQHHRTYVHDAARITVFVEKNASPPFDPTLLLKHDLDSEDDVDDPIYLWSYCKVCKKDMGFGALSETARKYSFGKYLELSFWGRGLKCWPELECPHDYQKDHIRYFNYENTSMRIHYDPIDLLEIVVPRTRITWKVDNDLKLKNEIFLKTEERWVRFMTSVKTRLKSIRIDSVLPDKAEVCKSEVDRLTKKSQEDQTKLIRELQGVYMNSKYYEVTPLNAVIRGMLERVADWDSAFAKFEADFLSDKDVRQLTIIQLKKMFSDNESKESLPSVTDGNSIASTETDDKTSSVPTTQTSTDLDEKLHQPMQSEESPASSAEHPEESGESTPKEDHVPVINEADTEGLEHLDLAVRVSPEIKSEEGTPEASTEAPTPEESKPEAQELPQEPPVEPRLELPVEAPPTSSAEAEDTIEESPSTIPRSQPTPIPPPLNSSLSLTERVNQLRQQHQINELKVAAAGSPEGMSEAPRVPERGSSRRAGLAVSPPIHRAISTPVTVLPRTHTNMGRTIQMKETKIAEVAAGGDARRSSNADSLKSEKPRLSFGLGALKNKKGSQSSIPRYIGKKKEKETKVSNLARHFEQLSREFEKERIKDRKQQAAKMQPSRAFLPRHSAKAIVEVYDDVDQAVQEPGPSDDDHLLDSQQSQAKSSDETNNTTETTEPDNGEIQPGSPEKESLNEPEHPSQPEETPTEPGTDDQKQTSQAGSDDEGEGDGGGSDAEESLLGDILPGVEEIAESLDSSEEIPLELPKHQKSSLMKMLTTFWAERSASGWTQLDYPLNLTDHIFIDSDVIVREDEPSSLIAFALSSEDYTAKLADIRHQWKMSQKETEDGSGVDSETKSLYPSDSGDAFIGEEDLEKALLRATGTHLKYQFTEGSAKMLCKIFYAEQFDALRRKCGAADRIIESLSRCMKWDSKGGKTKSVFLKTLDDRLIMKSLSPIETSAFLRFAPAYFNIMAEALFHDLPSVIAKMLGFFQIIIKNPVTNTEIKLDLLIMENLFYDRSPTRIFDLKGSMRNRKIHATGEQNEVLLDENMVEYIYESPLFAREHSKKLLRASVSCLPRLLTLLHVY